MRLDRMRIYIAVFHAGSADLRRPPCGAVAPLSSSVLPEFPFDVGDDPSFYAMRKHEGPLSWGVCRADVRNNLRCGDIVVFFSCRKIMNTGNSEYSLCCLATVEDKVRQTDLWLDDCLSIFTNYSNLLIKPRQSNPVEWDHFEPTLKGSRPHDDWLWRIACHEHFEREDFEEIQETNWFRLGQIIREHPVKVARNYIIFSLDRTKTAMLSRPPVVARHSENKLFESWNLDDFSQGVKRLTLGKAKQENARCRWLRTRNLQQPHRHIVFELPQSDAEAWRADFLRFIRRHQTKQK